MYGSIALVLKQIDKIPGVRYKELQRLTGSTNDGPDSEFPQEITGYVCFTICTIHKINIIKLCIIIPLLYR